ncbi:MAG: nuclear transport factor 2 family protein [Actinobacteria bacterium]|nr:nuclear transport factor 2 family protein [Actinomycetota bacterium]
MTEQTAEALVRTAFDAYTRGDLEGLLEHVDPDLTWTFLDPSSPDPEPAVCHGRAQLRKALQRQTLQGLTPSIEEIAARGERVLLVLHIPGLDQHRARPAADRTYFVLTVAGDQITALRACRERAEAQSAAGLTSATTDRTAADRPAAGNG